MTEKETREEYLNNGKLYFNERYTNLWLERMTEVSTNELMLIVYYLRLLDFCNDIEVIERNLVSNKNVLNTNIITNIILFSENYALFKMILSGFINKENIVHLDKKEIDEIYKVKKLMNEVKDFYYIKSILNFRSFRLTMDIAGIKRIIPLVYDEDNYFKGKLTDDTLVFGRIVNDENVFLYLISKDNVIKFIGIVEDNDKLLIKNSNSVSFTSVSFMELPKDYETIYKVSKESDSLMSELPFTNIKELFVDSNTIKPKSKEKTL